MKLTQLFEKNHVVRALFEAPQQKSKVQTQDNDLWDFDFGMPSEPTSKGSLTVKDKTTKNKAVTPPSEKQSKLQTQQSVSAASHKLATSADVYNKFLDKTKDITDIDPDHKDSTVTPTATPEPKAPENLPATINKSLFAHKDVNRSVVKVKWHDIKNLPGYAVEQIRGAFRPLFQHLSDTKLEDLVVSTSLDTPAGAMKQLIGGIMAHARRDDDFSLEAFDIDPNDYHVERAMLYHMDGLFYLVLKEKVMGQTLYYVYSGPGKDVQHVASPNQKHNTVASYIEGVRTVNNAKNKAIIESLGDVDLLKNIRKLK